VSDPLPLTYLAGYRTWKATRGPEGRTKVLSPISSRPLEWSPITLAQCGIRSRLPAPHPSHECGLYADTRWHPQDGGSQYTLVETGTPGHVRVTGRNFTINGAVLGAGRLLDHATGWRAQAVQVLAVAADPSGVLPTSLAAIRRSLTVPGIEVSVSGELATGVGPIYELADQWHVLVVPPARIPALAEGVALAVGKDELRRLRVEGRVAIPTVPKPDLWSWGEMARRLEILEEKLPALRRRWESPGAELRRLVSGRAREVPLPTAVARRKPPIEPGRDPASSGETLNQLASSEDPAIREQVAGNRSTPALTLVQLAGDPAVEVRQKVAYNPATPAAGLRALGADGDGVVMLGVAQHPAAPAATLRQLAAKAPDRYLAAAVAGNISAPPDLLEALADRSSPLPFSGHPRLLTALAGNWSTPGATLLALAAPGNSVENRERVARNRSAPPEALLLGANDVSSRVTSVIAKRGDAPAAALAHLANAPEAWIRRAVAENPATSAATLDAMARTGDLNLQRAVSLNRSTGNDTLRYLMESGCAGADTQRNAQRRLYPRAGEVAFNVYSRNVPPGPGPGHPGFSWDALDLEALGADHELLVRVVHAPDAPAELLSRIALSLAEDWTVRVAIAGHDRATSATLERLALDPHWMVRGNVACNSHAGTGVLEKLAVDLDPVVRTAVAANPHTPLDVKRFMVFDEDPATASAAQLAVWRAGQTEPIDLAGLAAEL